MYAIYDNCVSLFGQNFVKSSPSSSLMRRCKRKLLTAALGRTKARIEKYAQIKSANSRKKKTSTDKNAQDI